jgi:hypothetical protein
MTAAVAAPVVSRTFSSVNPIVSISHNLPFPFPQLFHSWVGLENYLASACDVCCDLRRRRRRRKKSFLDTGSIGTLRKTLRKLVLEKQKISFLEDQFLRNISHKIALSLCLFHTEETSQKRHHRAKVLVGSSSTNGSSRN